MGHYGKSEPERALDVEILIGMAFLLGCLFLAIGSIKAYGAEKNANLALEKVSRLQRRLDIVREKAEFMERGLENLQRDMATIEFYDEADEDSEDAAAESSTSESAIGDQPEPVEEPGPESRVKSVPISTALPKQSKLKPDESSVENAPEISTTREKDKLTAKEAAKGAETEDPISGLTMPGSKWAEKFQGMNWETFVGTYLLRIVGVGFMTVAVFIGLALVAQKTGPGFRVFLGYCVSAGLLAGGRVTERKYPGYARVVYGGGLAVAYFVTFATHYIPMSRIFENALPSLGGMAAIVGIWAAIAQKRQSQVIALLVTVLGHFTIALTTFTVPDPGIYSVFGVVLLGFGSAFFLLRNRWYYIVAFGMLASYANHFALMTQSTSRDTTREFTLGMAVLTTYLLIFALAELFSPEKLRRETIPNAFRSIFVALNTALYFALGSLLVDGYSFSHDYHHFFRYSLAATMLGIGVLYYLRRKHDPLYNTYTAKAIAFATFGLAFQFSGNTLTTWLAIEMIVLLFSSRRSGLVITRVLAHTIAVITFAHGLFSFLTQMESLPYDHATYAATLIQSVIPVIAFGLFSQAYQRTDWNTRMRLGLKVPKDLHTLFWQLDLVPEPLPDSKHGTKPLNGLFFPYLYAGAGALLFARYSLRLFDMDDRFNLYALVGVGMLALSWLLNSRPYAVVSLFYVVLTTVITFHTMVDGTFSALYAFGVAALILCALATEKNLLPGRDALVFHRMSLSPYLLYGVAIWSVSLYVNHFFEGQRYIIALLALSVVCAGLTRRLHANALALGGTVILFCAHILWHFGYLDLGPPYSEPDFQRDLATFIAILIVVLCVMGDRFSERWDLKVYGPVLVFIAFTTGLHFIHYESAEPWFGLAAAAMAFGFLGYTLMVRSEAAGTFALLTTLIASLAHTAWAYNTVEEFLMIPTILGFAASIALWIVFERLNSLHRSSRFEDAQSYFGVVSIVATTFLALVLLERIPALADLYLTVSWALLAVVFFGVALMSTQKRYRYAGLAILALSTFRVIVYDTSALDAINRVLAFGGLGTVLLGLGFGYSKAFGEDPGSKPMDDNT